MSSILTRGNDFPFALRSLGILSVCSTIPYTRFDRIIKAYGKKTRFMSGKLREEKIAGLPCAVR